MTQGAQAGDVIGGRYQLVHAIASGGMGRVWKAYDARLQTDVAVKELWLAGPMPPEQRAALLKRAELEALSAVRLRDHPNIVTVHDVVVERDIPWIVMQLVAGGTLQERLRPGPLTVTETRRVATALLAALDAAHRLGIVHRDVKPANVMITEDDQILLGDFGIAAPESGTGITSTGVVIGSAPYLAPERAAGRPGRASSDLFSLGVTLYEAVEGLSPFLRDSWVASAHAVRYDEAPPMRRAGRLKPLISALLAKDPADRPTIAEAVALLKESGKQKPKQQTPQQTTPTEVVPAPPDAEEATDRATLTVTNQCGATIHLYLGVDHLGQVSDRGTTVFRTGTTAARTLRVGADSLGSVSRVLRLEPRHPVTLTVHRKGDALALTGDGIVERPQRKPTTPPPAKPAKSTPAKSTPAKSTPAKSTPAKSAASNANRPKPKTSRQPATPPQPPSTSSSAQNWGYAAAALVVALLLYAFNAGFSGWVSHYLHGSAASAKAGDCLHRDKQNWIKVPCWSRAGEYKVRTAPAHVLTANSWGSCPLRTNQLWVAASTYVCAERHK